MATFEAIWQKAREEIYLPASYLEPRWYAAYTCANHEKRVAGQLAQRSFECYLPLYKTVRRWKDRRKHLELPLFPGYVFVHLALRNRLPVLQTPGLVHLVGFDGQPTALPEEEMEALRKGFTHQVRVEPHPYLTVGRRVRIRSGPLEGLEGILMRRRGVLRVILSVNLIKCSASIEVDSWEIEPAPQARSQSQNACETPH